MSHEEFDALVELIEKLSGLHAASREHMRDAPRQKALAREREWALDTARDILVL